MTYKKEKSNNNSKEIYKKNIEIWKLNSEN